MSREILFRGKRIKTGKWGYGDLIRAKGKTFVGGEEENIFWMEAEVYPGTVGQYTGLCDKNGKKIFEGDVMQLCSATYPCTVYWDGIGWAWKMNGKRRDIDLTREKMAVIGNIHDNAELLKEESK